ncbi:hypothetical protein ACFC08_22155 [Streptomyces sp. NPDC056112]|uniref:hypothetical protein n=1 Tax=unclassified Streptomyces TaxID=2593676 RepID=UPI001CD5FB18|nr:MULTISPECIES: hypothetical protein [unclassified Streptomyces]
MTKVSRERHRKLTRNQLDMILDAVNGLALDFQWIRRGSAGSSLDDALHEVRPLHRERPR